MQTAHALGGLPASAYSTGNGGCTTDSRKQSPKLRAEIRPSNHFAFQAHAHARNAALETKRSNPVAASEEHDLAAAEFATAAQGTSDLEALRILRLLEQHHKKLGQLLRSRHEKPTVESLPHSTSSSAVSPATAPTQAKPDTNQPSSPETAIHAPRLPRGLRSNPRDLSSSIASNLASARGIPSARQKRSMPVSPLVSNQHADGQIAQEETRGKSISRQGTDTSDGLLSPSKQLSRPPWAPPMIPATAKSEIAEQPDEQSSDAPFQQFYATFESLISKLSAPLAFAGLPLTSSAKPPASPAQTSPKSPKSSSRPGPAAASVDYSQLISRAALRAVSGTGTAINPSESFYVVPTTGGTISYAEIMNRAEREEARNLRHHRQTSNLSNISEDDFVDAQSTILPNRPRSHESNTPTPPSALGRFRRGVDEAKVNGKTMEELALENQALKHLSDTLSRRLHVFEMSAQTSSAALVQSIRSLHRSPLTTPLLSPENSRGKNSSKPLGMGTEREREEEAMAKRIAELEDILRKSDARARKKEEENAKLKETITKYKEKWDSLKAGAKARRERERGGKDGSGEKGGDRHDARDDGVPGGA